MSVSSPLTRSLLQPAGRHLLVAGEQNSLSQPSFAKQFNPFVQTPQSSPPQSTSTSSPLRVVSSHLGSWQVSSRHTFERQSLPTSQALLSAHGSQPPPQSTSVSEPSRRSFEQLLSFGAATEPSSPLTVGKVAWPSAAATAPASLNDECVDETPDPDVVEAELLLVPDPIPAPVLALTVSSLSSGSFRVVVELGSCVLQFLQIFVRQTSSNDPNHGDQRPAP